MKYTLQTRCKYLLVLIAASLCLTYYQMSNWLSKNRVIPFPRIHLSNQLNFTHLMNSTDFYGKRGQDFQMVSPHPEKMYFYSAYFDEEHQVVKIIGGTKERTDQKIICNLLDEEQILVFVQTGNLYHFERNWDSLPYVGTLVLCPLDPSAVKPPSYVSLTLTQNQDQLDLTKSSNLFQIKYSPKLTNFNFVREKYEFAVCVQPTFSYENPIQFMEWLEYFKLMGVERFTFYNESIGPQTSCLMEHLEEDGLVEILKWSPVFEPNVEIHVCGTNHRFIRGHAKYLVNADFDEFIVPISASNFSALIAQLTGEADLDLELTSAFVFQNSFFYINESKPDVNITSMSERLFLTKYDLRMKEMNKFYERSKYIGVPDLISEPGVHYIYKSVGSAGMFNVPTEFAYLHHYRMDWDWGQVEIGGSIVDRSAFKFVKPVEFAVKRLLEKYGRSCDLNYV